MASFALLLLASSVRAQTASPADASVRFKRGVELYQEGDYRAAVAEFQRAYEIAPNYKVLYNIGQAHFELQNYVGAYDALSKYLADGGSEIDPTRADEVRSQLEKASSRIARVTVTCNVADAVLSVDDVEVARCSKALPVRVSAGQRRITATKPGFAPTSQSVTVTGGDEAKVSLLLVPIGGAESTTNAGQPTRPGVPFWVLLGTTGAFGIGAGIAGGLAVAQDASHQDLLATQGATLGDIQESASELRQRTIATDVLLATTGASAVVTLVLAFTTTSSAPPSGKGAHVAPLLGPGSVGVFGAF